MRITEKRLRSIIRNIIAENYYYRYSLRRDLFPGEALYAKEDSGETAADHIASVEQRKEDEREYC
jgi:hypothetical protein